MHLLSSCTFILYISKGEMTGNLNQVSRLKKSNHFSWILQKRIFKPRFAISVVTLDPNARNREFSISRWRSPLFISDRFYICNTSFNKCLVVNPHTCLLCTHQMLLTFQSSHQKCAITSHKTHANECAHVANWVQVSLHFSFGDVHDQLA